ncbi:MAG: heme-binding protein [Desulfomonilaceae bacterium]
MRPTSLPKQSVQGGLEQAGTEAFGRLFRYISGGSRTRFKVAMTAPVGQHRLQERKWSVSFTMLSSYTLSGHPSRVRGPQGHLA